MDTVGCCFFFAVALVCVFGLLKLGKTVFRLKMGDKDLLLVSFLLVIVVSVVKNVWLGIYPWYLPFPYWLTPIDCF